MQVAGWRRWARYATRPQLLRALRRGSGVLGCLCVMLAGSELHAQSDKTPTHRWMPRHVSLGVGGVATSAPGRGTTYSPSVGGAFDVSAIGLLTSKLAWRVEGFVHLQDRSVASERGLLAQPAPESCTGAGCSDEPREMARRTSGFSAGIEHHPMKGRIGLYSVAMLGVASSNSFGDAGRCLGFAPSVGVGVLAPLNTGLDGFAVEARWRRVPTVLGAVNAGVISLSLRF